MSRIGNKHIELPAGVTITEKDGYAIVSGPKGTLNVIINEGIKMHIEGNLVTFKRANDAKQIKQNHGTTRANVHNAVVGVSEGYKRVLELRGIGYKAALKGTSIELWAGYSHTMTVEAMPGVKISIPNATDIVVEGIDKQAVGQTAALIRGVRPPEPYLGKGIRYKGEVVVTKEGKRAGAGK
ncbi:MAG: 50S ribosomal protein L6 [Erysipelotrichaceae bacterium]|jgi:large subunit ribosomal protein L6|nr:50S ribosomal protein L6 [Erysipelotrichaceae bacterium]